MQRQDSLAATSPAPFALYPGALPQARFKASIEDFVVEELPAYDPSGEGEHLYVTFVKRGRTTPDAVREIARALGVDDRGAGFAGMKDKLATTTQTASFPFPLARGDAESALAEARLEGIEITSVKRHGNKLKPGHLRGNRFRIVLRDLEAGAAATIGERLARLGETGVPNAFGPQRFGRDGDNPERALAWLAGKERGPRDRRDQRFVFSSLQSLLFNEVLAQRVTNETWSDIVLGDLAKKREGALFAVGEADLEDARRRAKTCEVSATGPMFGASMRWPEGDVLVLERSVLDRSGIDDAGLERAKNHGEGTRRSLRMEIGEVTSERIESAPAGETLETLETLAVSFVLPKGGYATTVLGQVCALRQERDARPEEASEA